MSQINRLSSGGRIDRNRPLTFSFNGQHYQGYAGDTLAAALLANGVDIVGRSFKYSRARGIVAAGAEEPNAILQIGSREATQIPNVRATQQALYGGLVATSTNGWPNVQNDLMGIFGKVGGKLMPPGFYYKTFMYPQSMWMTYEKYIRKAAGLGRAPTEVDPDSYDWMNHHCDVLVVGAGPAGLAAALAAARSGARVILADEQEEFGGSLLDTRETLDGKPAAEWVADAVAELQGLPEVILLPRSTVNGYHDHNFLTIHERRTDHLGEVAPLGQVRQRVHRVRAKRVVLPPAPMSGRWSTATTTCPATCSPARFPPMYGATAWHRARNWCWPPTTTTPTASPSTGRKPACKWWPSPTPGPIRAASGSRKHANAVCG